MESPSSAPQESIIEALNSLPKSFDSPQEFADYLDDVYLRSLREFLRNLLFERGLLSTCNLDDQIKAIRNKSDLEIPGGKRLILFDPPFIFMDEYIIFAKMNERSRLVSGAIFYGWHINNPSEWVVIKTINPDSENVDRLDERTQREAGFLIKRGEHPSWIRPHEVIYTFSLAKIAKGDQGDSREIVPHIVLPFVAPGIQLHEFSLLPEFERVIRNEKFQAMMGINLCYALDDVHEQGTVYRDLKPPNIMLRSGHGFVKLIDGGLVLMPNYDRLTPTGDAVGTPPFMSPEQACGERLDNRSDIYSAGCILFFLATGRCPFIGLNAGEFMEAHNERPLEFLPDDNVSEQMKRAICWAMEKSPDNRPQNVREFARFLQENILRVSDEDEELLEAMGPARDFGISGDMFRDGW